MAIRFTKHLAIAAGLFLLASCGSGVGNASPRIDPIPQQLVAGGTMLNLDVAPFVTDPEGTPLAFQVVSGGGSFAGPLYSNMFDTMGTYTVTFAAIDANGLVTTSSFDVRVTSADFVVVRVDNDGLMLLDTDTEKFLSVSADSQPPSFATGLSQGQLVYQQQVGANQRLMVYRPATRQNRQVGEAQGDTAIYLTKTSADEIVFQGGTVTDPDLYAHAPLTGLTRVISNTPGEVDGNPMVNTADLVFYERGSGGQGDVYWFDPATGMSTVVSADANDERLRAALPDGGVVFSRVGTGGEHDLYYFRIGLGLVEIGADIPALATLHKTFGGFGSASQVVFHADNGMNRELYYWNPATGQTTAIDTGAFAVFEAVTAQDEVVYRVEASGTDHDLFWYDMTDDGNGAIADTADLLTFRAVTTDGASTFAVYQDSTPTEVFVFDITNTSGSSATSGGNVGLDAVLPGGNLVWSRIDGTAIGLFDVATGSNTFTTTATGIAFGGAGTGIDDFLWTADVGGQDDLFLYDASAAATVTVSNDAGVDAFQAMTSAGEVLFTRVLVGNTNADLFLWDPTDLSTERLTDEDAVGELHDHAVLGGYSGTLP